MLRIFVKRGAIWRFHRLTRDARSLPISVEWDRRREDRRSSSAPVSDEQRREDRRGEAPFTWDKAQFVVVEEPSLRREFGSTFDAYAGEVPRWIPRGVSPARETRTRTER